MEEKIKNITILKELFSLLYLNKSDNQEYDNFYKKENLLPYLNNIVEHALSILRTTVEENKWFYFYGITSRVKELYCGIEEYEKSLNTMKEYTNSVFEGLVSKKHEFDESDIPLIVNELIARLETNNVVDDLVYNVLKIIPTNLIRLLSFYQPFYYGEHYLGFVEAKLISSLIAYMNRLSKENETVLLSRYIFHILCVIKEYVNNNNAFDEDEEYESRRKQRDDLYKTLESNISSLRELYPTISKPLLNAIELYSFLLIMSLNRLITDKYNPDDITQLTSAFITYFDSLQADFCDLYKEEISEVFRDVIETLMDDDGYIIGLKIVFDVLNKKSLPKYKKQIIEELLLKTRYIDELFTLTQYGLIVQIYKNGVNEHCLKNSYFEIAYSLSQCNLKEESKKIYEDAIARDINSSAVYNNLGVIYEQNDKEYEKAIRFYQKATELDFENKQAPNNIKRVQKILEDIAKKQKKMKELYFKKIQTWHRKLLFAIYKLSDEEGVTIEKLAEVTKQNERNTEENLKYLQKIEMIEISGDKIFFDETIKQLIKEYIDPKLERQIVKVDNSKLYRPIFYHESEILLYRILTELFPQHFIFPNMSLKTIVDIDKIKELLDDSIIKYLFMAHVDFAVINTSNYFPILAFEKDSDYNDTEYSKENTVKKDMIFRTSGIPLIRLRFNSGMNYEKLKSEVRNATKSLLLEMKDDSTSSTFDEISKELDIKKFGIVNSPISLDTIRNDWEQIVGKGIAQKSKIIDIEDNNLIIEMSSELKPIIEMSIGNIKEKIFDKHNFLKEIDIKWY